MKLRWANTRKSGVILTELGEPLGHMKLDEFIPYDDTNSEGKIVIEWEAAGNKIDPYAPSGLEADIDAATTIAALKAIMKKRWLNK